MINENFTLAAIRRIRIQEAGHRSQEARSPNNNDDRQQMLAGHHYFFIVYWYKPEEISFANEYLQGNK